MSYRESRKLLAISPIFQKGKTQIPAKVRRLLDIKDGDELVYYHENGKITIEKNF